MSLGTEDALITGALAVTFLLALAGVVLGILTAIRLTTDHPDQDSTASNVRPS